MIFDFVLEYCIKQSNPTNILSRYLDYKGLISNNKETLIPTLYTKLSIIKNSQEREFVLAAISCYNNFIVISCNDVRPIQS